MRKMIYEKYRGVMACSEHASKVGINYIML